MKYLFVVNSNRSIRTRTFWDHNSHLIGTYFDHYDVFVPEANNVRSQLTLEGYDIIVLVGDDRFFSAFVNTVFYELSDNKSVAFIPDHRGSAIASSLGLSTRLKSQLELISKKQTILLDILKCHYIDKRGMPNSRFILNDVLLGFPPIRGPLLFKTIAELAKNPPIIPLGKKQKSIQLMSEREIVYEGSYIFAAAVLGNRIIDGPKIPSRSKVRGNLMKFDYYQLNAFSLTNLKIPFARLFHTETDDSSGYLFNGKYKDLILKGEGRENSIIADGVHLGRLPATITFLPKALKVIAPLLTVRVTQTWGQKLTHAGIPKPIGSRNSLGKNSDTTDP